MPCGLVKLISPTKAYVCLIFSGYSARRDFASINEDLLQKPVGCLAGLHRFSTRTVRADMLSQQTEFGFCGYLAPRRGSNSLIQIRLSHLWRG